MDKPIKTKQDFRRACLRGAWRGLRSQGFEQAMNRGACVWRTKAGRRCAVGWLIPDSSLPRDGVAEGTAPIAISEGLLAPPLAKWAERNHKAARRVLGRLQRAHDLCWRPDMMEDRLRALAVKWNVELPEDDE